MRNEKIRVLIISQYFPPDVSGGSTRAYNYAKCLSDQNYKVTVVTAPPHQHGSIPEKYREKMIVREKMSELDVIRVWVPSILHSSVRNSTILVCSFLFSSLFPIFSVKPDIIFAFEPNLFSIIPAYIYSKIRGGVVIRIVDDLWPELLYERGLIKSKLLRRLMNRLTKFSYTYPKFIIPLNEEVKDIIHDSYKISNEKIESISHGVDLEIFTSIERNRREFFVVMYSGSLIESYDFDIIINVAKKLKNKKIKFVIRGKGRLFSYLLEQKEKFQIENLEISSDFLPLEELPNTLAESDVLLVPMRGEQSLNLSLPTKILEYQAVGRPIICCSNGAVGNYVERTESGIRVNVGDSDALAETILKMESDPELCKRLGRNGRMYAEQNLRFEKIAQRLSNIIQKTL